MTDDYRISSDHEDLKVLGKALIRNGIRFRYQSKWNGETYEKLESPGINGLCSSGREGNYIKCPQIINFNDNDVIKIKKAIDEASKEAKEHTFEFCHTSDYEVDFDGDRSWDASFGFFSHKKTR